MELVLVVSLIGAVAFIIYSGVDMHNQIQEYEKKNNS